MSSQLSRRAFLRGRFQARAVPRPPGAGDEPGFLTACTRCQACIDACPEHALALDTDGFPRLALADAGCTFCDACRDACESGALRRAGDWAWRAVIGDACLALNRVHCRTCGDACDTGAIRFRLCTGGVSEPLIDTDTCTGCGFCVGPCPATAIHLEQPAHVSVGGAAAATIGVTTSC